MQVLVDSTGGVNVCGGSIRSATGVTDYILVLYNDHIGAQSLPIDPLEPVLSTVTGNEILQVIGGWDVLGFGCTEEVLADGVGVVAEGDLDGTLEAVEVAVVAGTLVGFMLLHQWEQFLGSPALGLEVCHWC